VATPCNGEEGKVCCGGKHLFFHMSMWKNNVGVTVSTMPHSIVKSFISISPTFFLKFSFITGITAEKDTKNNVTWWCRVVPTTPTQAIISRKTPHAMTAPITEISTIYATAFAYAATPMRINATTYNTHVH